MENIKIHYYKNEFDVACNFITNYAYKRAKRLKSKINIANLMSVVSCITLLCLMAHILRIVMTTPLYPTEWWGLLVIFIAINIISVFVGKTLWYNIKTDPFIDEYTLANASVPTKDKTRKQIFAEKYRQSREQMNDRIFMLHKIFSQTNGDDIALELDDKLLAITYNDNGTEKEFAINIDGLFNQSDIDIPLEKPEDYDKIIITPIYCIVVFSETSDKSIANKPNS